MRDILRSQVRGHVFSSDRLWVVVTEDGIGAFTDEASGCITGTTPDLSWAWCASSWWMRDLAVRRGWSLYHD